MFQPGNFMALIPSDPGNIGNLSCIVHLTHVLNVIVKFVQANCSRSWIIKRLYSYYPDLIFATSLCEKKDLIFRPAVGLNFTFVITCKNGSCLCSHWELNQTSLVSLRIPSLKLYAARNTEKRTPRGIKHFYAGSGIALRSQERRAVVISI